jgi:signal peptidase I
MPSKNKIKKEVFSIGLIILLAFVFRTVVASPYQIPSESMLPTLKIGDFLFVTKYSYAIKVPLTNKNLWQHSLPNRGDVVVFSEQGPGNKSIIKRVVGVPGDVLDIENGRIKINEQPLVYTTVSDRSIVSDHPELLEREVGQLFKETLDDKPHWMFKLDPSPGKGGHFVVPKGHVFVMGDNRDRSLDSRFWGFLPVQDIKGRARFLWLSLDKFNPAFTIGPVAIPSIRWNRIGQPIT